MPHEITLDPDRRVLVMRIWGALTPGEISTMIVETREDSRITRDYLHLVDCRELESVAAISAGDVRSIAADRLQPTPKRAIVAPDAATFGLGRMFAALRNLKESNEEVGVFRTMTEAERWLGV